MLYMVTDGFSLQNNTKKQFLRKVANSVILGSKNLEKRSCKIPVGLSSGIYNIHKQYSSFIQTLF